LREAYFRAAGGSLRLPTQPRASARGSQRAWQAVIALAALIAIVGGIWAIVSLNHRTVPQILVDQNGFSPTSEQTKVVVLPKAKSAALVRALNPAERLVLIADKEATKKQAAQAKRKTPVDPLASLRRLDNASLTRLATATKDAMRRRDAISLILQRNDLQSFLYFVLRPSTCDDALAVLHAMPNPPTQELLAELDHQQVDYRLAAAKALGGICNHQIDQTLMKMVATNNHRREAIAALLSCSDPRAKQMLTMAEAYTSADEIRSVQRDLNKTF
jgi:hypothetical protein